MACFISTVCTGNKIVARIFSNQWCEVIHHKRKAVFNKRAVLNTDSEGDLCMACMLQKECTCVHVKGQITTGLVVEKTSSYSNSHENIAQAILTILKMCVNL